MTPMKSVLMISPYFVPRRRVGALRTFKFAIHLKESGYKPVILTIKDPCTSATAAEQELLKKLTIIELSSPVDRTVQSKETSPGQGALAGKQGRIAEWIDRHTPSDTWIYFYLLHYFKVMKVAASAKPDIVWATGDPWSSLVLGSLIAKKMSVPFVCDFRDPWTRSGISLRDRSLFSRYWDRILEKKVLSHASKVVFTSRSAEQDYKQNFSSLQGKTSVIYNASNDQIAPDGKNSASPFTGFEQGVLSVTFYGTFRRLSPIAPVADMLSQLRDQSQESYSRIIVHSFGKPDDEQVKYARLMGVEKSFVFHDKVKPEEGTEILNQSDILLLSTHPARKNIVPAKLWDYLYSEKLILSIVPNPEVGEIIEEFRAGEHFHPKDLTNAASKLSEWAAEKRERGDDSLRREPLSEIQKEKLKSKSRAAELAGIFDIMTGHD